jgi:hypothetical protein
MGKFWLKIWIWIKVTLFALLLLYAISFVLENHGNPAKVWVWFYDTVNTNTLMVALFAFLAGVVGTILVRTTFKTVRQIRDVQLRNQQEKMQRDLEEMKAKASMLRPKTSADEIGAT